MLVRAHCWVGPFAALSLVAAALVGCGEREQSNAANKAGGGVAHASPSADKFQVNKREGLDLGKRETGATPPAQKNAPASTGEGGAGGISNKPSEGADTHVAKPAINFRKLAGTGTGRSFDDALKNALLRVVEQVNGTSVSRNVDTESLVSDYRKQTQYERDLDLSGKGAANAEGSAKGSKSILGAKVSTDVSGDANGSGQFGLSGKFSSSSRSSGEFDSNKSIVKVSVSTAGSVSRFQVLKSKVEDGAWFVTIVAEVPVYTAAAIGKRLKLAVLPLRKANTKSATEFELAFRTHVVDSLSQSGKIAMLDREFTAEADAEISQMSLDSFGKTEVAKIGNKLGADYIIVGAVRQAESIREAIYVEALGRRVFGAAKAKAQTTFRLVEVATGVVLTSATIGGEDLASKGLEMAAKEHAVQASSRILEALYPIRIEAVSDGIFYMGRGGDDIKVGDQFRVLKQGAPIRDTDTGELLGYAEKEVALVVVNEVQARLSKASVMNGAPLSPIDNAKQLIARRIDVSKSEETTAVEKRPASQKAPKAANPTASDAPKEGVDY